VSSSRDFVSGIGFLAMVTYFFGNWTTIRDHVLQLMDLVSRSYDQPYGDASRVAISTTFEVMLATIAPPISILVLVILVAGMLSTLGPVFSFENVKIKFEHISPASGLKRIFSTRNAVEFCKSLLKVVLLGTVLFLVLRYWLPTMFHTPNCGGHCVVPILLAAVKPILAVAVLAFILIGVSDFAIQRWLFLRDMRMGKTEVKRERKDIEGDPLILSARKRQRYTDSKGPRLGLGAASILIAGPEHIAGIYYDRAKQPVPLIVIRTRGDSVKTTRLAAGDLTVPIAEAPELAEALVEHHRTGDFLQTGYFSDVARLLVQHHLVS
jgi:type III secretion protein U